LPKIEGIPHKKGAISFPKMLDRSSIKWYLWPMNKLSKEERAKIIGCLVEGCSLRSTERMTGFSKKAIARLQVEIGKACMDYSDKVMRDLPCKVLQVDELWSFCYCKERNVPEVENQNEGIGDAWVWIALDAENKLIPAYHVGKRTPNDAYVFLGDLKKRLANRVQLTSDGSFAYLQAVSVTFNDDIDYSQLVKLYGKPQFNDSRYSPPVCVGARKKKMIGNPDRNLISTSFIERQNLTIRMQSRRFTRLTNAFSKKLENHKMACALHFFHYNFCRIHQTLRVTPVMQAGIENHVWSIVEIADLLEK
jgi:IS1 family transposase